MISHDIARPKFKVFAEEIENTKADKEYRESLLEFLLSFTRHDDILFGTAVNENNTPFVKGLIKIHDRRALWLRSLESFKPKSKNTWRKFGELTHHLFDQYDGVPNFMERVWLRNDRKSWRYRDWFIHLGRGHNLRTAKSPIPITKKMAHHFLGAPDDYTVEQALRWGQLKSFGAHDTAIHAVNATLLGRSFQDEDFWITVLRFVAANPMLDSRQIGPIIDFIQAQKYEPVRVETAPGQWREDPPRSARLFHVRPHCDNITAPS